ncbi:MAG: alpha/beta hydrolase [Clostridiales bacterium]|nr:alpha/beta hydrolase [Clostridiales bacterium]
MKDLLRFDPANYQVKTCVLDGRCITYRAFEGLNYCAAPLDPIQKLNLFVPEVYYDGGTVNGYSLHTAPIFAPNTVGGYLPGQADEPGFDHREKINAVFAALEHGYVVACAGIRGRTSGKRSDEFFEGSKATVDQVETGRFVGKAPALIVDMKAAIRYLRYNRNLIPGDTDHIITSGTSAGGALSALAGATGNSPDYDQALAAIGAATERDDIFAASCYCPIHNLEHADAAYEWLFGGHDHYSSIRFRKVDGKVIKKGVEGDHTPKQQRISRELKEQFPSYVNSLNLQDENGRPLTLDEDGTGSFLDYVKRYVLASAQRELETHDSAVRLNDLAVAGSAVEKQSYLTIRDGKVTDIDWDGFVTAIVRMKMVPAFDALDLKSPENEEFGTESVPAKHFTAYAQTNSEVESELADRTLIQMMNPTCYIGKANTAPHWRIRHGAYDRDTSLAIPVILATLLQNKGFHVDFALPWGLPHSGDYDLDDLFAWIDNICRY